jgi:hypothetical protein
MRDPDAERDEDPASYTYWQRHGFQGRPPWRRGYRWGYLALSLALVALLLVLILILRVSA